MLGPGDSKLKVWGLTSHGSPEAHSPFLRSRINDPLDDIRVVSILLINQSLKKFFVEMADSTPKSYHTDPTLYLYTSLSSGSSSIITATSRMETILKAKKIPFQALDVATDEKARMLWGRRAGKRKLPGLVRQGMIIGDVEEVEEWNEYGELMERINEGKRREEPPTMMSAGNTPSKAPPTETANPAVKEPASTPAHGKEVEIPDDEQLPTTPSRSSRQTEEKHLTTAMQSIGFEAAQKAKAAKSSKLKSSIEASDNAPPAKAADTPLK